MFLLELIFLELLHIIQTKLFGPTLEVLCPASSVSQGDMIFQHTSFGISSWKSVQVPTQPKTDCDFFYNQLSEWATYFVNS